jgi:hypothetical protein
MGMTPEIKVIRRIIRNLRCDRDMYINLFRSNGENEWAFRYFALKRALDYAQAEARIILLPDRYPK